MGWSDESTTFLDESNRYFVNFPLPCERCSKFLFPGTKYGHVYAIVYFFLLTRGLLLLTHFFFILELTLPKTQKPGFCWRHSLTRGFLMNTEVNPGSWFPESIWKILGIFNQSDWECLQPTICYGVNEIAYLVAHPTARKWVITPVQNGISRDDPVITGVN